MRVISSGVGAITESDVILAESSEAVLLGFNVRADNAGKRKADEAGIDIRYYSVIYGLIDDVKAAMSGMLAPEHREQILGIAEVRDVFRSSKFGAAAGCMVQKVLFIAISQSESCVMTKSSLQAIYNLCVATKTMSMR